jgi:predicted nucleotide-binding protein
MVDLATTFAKLAGLKKMVAAWLPPEPGLAGYCFDPARVLGAFQAYERHSAHLRHALPGLFGDLPERSIPVPTKTTDFGGRGYIGRRALEVLGQDIDYIFELRAHSELAAPNPEVPRRIFISHGRADYWREVQAFVERDLGVATLELAQEPNQGRTVLQKLQEESARCSFAIVVMSADDESSTGERRARENVMHEIGYFQGKFGLARLCLLHEEATNIPSNIHGLVYIPFPTGLVSAAFGALGREVRTVFAPG